MKRLRANFAALAVRDFRLQWMASTLGTTAFMTRFVLVPIIAFELSESYVASGLAAMGNGVGTLILTSYGGVIADRFSKKPTVLISHIAEGLVIAGSGILIVTDLITVPLLFVSTLIGGSAFALTGPARQSWVAELVPGELVPNAIALQQMGVNIAQVLGPTVASIAVLAFGVDAGSIYLGVALLFVFVIPLTLLLPKTPPGSGTRRTPLRDLQDGFRYAKGNPRIRALLLFLLVIVICGFAIQILIPGILFREFSRSADEAVLVNAVLGVAALSVNLPLAGLVGGRHAWLLLIGAAVLMGVGLWLVAWSPVFGLLLVFSALAGAGRSAALLINQSIMMSHTRPEYFGRVTSFILIMFALQSVIAPVWGLIADAIGGRETLLLVGAIVVGAAVLMLPAWRRIERLPLEAGTPAAATEASAGDSDE